MRIIYSNGFIAIRVEIYDTDVCFHLQNYLISEKSDENRYEWKIKVYSNPFEQNYSEYEMEEKRGEYGEIIKKYYLNQKKIYVNESNGTTIIFYNKKSVEIYNSDKKGLFIDTYRTVRQLLINDLLNRGGVVVHSSSVYLGGRGYLFVGGKGAGKTTSLFQYLNSSRSDVLYGSNERTILVPKGDDILMFGWQGTAFVGVGTIYSTIGLRQLVDVHKKTGGTAYWLSEHQLVENEYINRLILMNEQVTDVTKKIWLTSNEIANLTNRRICNYGYLDKIIWPKLLLEKPQNIRKVCRKIDSEFIRDLSFFGDWIVDGRKEQECNDEIFKRLSTVPQYEISGKDLFFDLDDIS